jgi:predicted dehydrogenase
MAKKSSAKEVRLGIIGVGNMGSVHAKNIQAGKVPRLRLTALCDSKTELMKDYADVEKFTSADALIKSGTVDAVLVATPHYDHTTIGIKVLKAGLHLLVEKPLSVHKADCEKLIKAHTSKKQVFAAMFNQRTDPFYIKIKELIDSGELGKVRRINWIITDWFRTEAYYASGGWRATWAGEGGGVLLNQCPHNLDLYQWMFGLPSKVRGFCSLGRYHNIEVEDDVTAYFEYPDGATGVFITSTGEAPGTNRLEITAERGRLVYEADKLTYTRNEQETSEFSKTTDQAFARPSHWNVEIPVNGHGEQHIGIMKNFTAAILDKTPLIAPAKEGINSVELGNSILYSSLKEKTVDMPLNSASFAKALNHLIKSSTFKKKKAQKTVKADMSASF